MADFTKSSEDVSRAVFHATTEDSQPQMSMEDIMRACTDTTTGKIRVYFTGSSDAISGITNIW